MKIGDRVMVKSTGQRGVLGDMYDDIVYIDMDNGVEMEYGAADLMLESEYETPLQVKEREKEEMTDLLCFASQQVLDAITSGIINLGRVLHMQASSVMMEIGGGVNTWEDLNAFQKLNFISMASDISTEKWIEGYNNGKLNMLQLVAFANTCEKIKEMSDEN